MGRKKKEIKIEIPDIPATVLEGSLPPNDPLKVGHLDGDFGRQDLNAMKDKINEIIDQL